MKTNSDQRGFTMVEILVCIIVAGIITISLSQVVNTYIHVSKRGRYLNLANSYIEAKTEALRNSGFSSLNNGTYSLTSELTNQLPPSRSASMVVSSPLTGIKQVVLNVSYNDNAQNNTYSYTTYIGELGVGQ
jgi:prepilin-type N-terminal cleavage/methylation domain-containing protein